jgi:GxxExxY protein
MHEEHEPVPRETERVAQSIVDAALAVHRALGPGLLESAYEACLTHELERRGHAVLKQVALPVIYDTVKLDGYRIDLIVDDAVIIEVKAVEALTPLHEAQVLTYLRLSHRRLGFIGQLQRKAFEERDQTADFVSCWPRAARPEKEALCLHCDLRVTPFSSTYGPAVE